MAFSPRLVTLIGGVFGGSCGLVPLLSWRGSDPNTKPIETKVLPLPTPVKPAITSPVPAPVPKQIPQPEPKKENEGNCEVREPLKKLGDVIWSFGHGENFYITISCQKTSSNINEKLSGPWTGLFPKTLINEGSLLGPRTKLDIKTKTTTESEGSYSTIFSGEGINGSPITGTWGEESLETTDQEVKVISVPSTIERIYITY